MAPLLHGSAADGVRACAARIARGGEQGVLEPQDQLIAGMQAQRR
jgi:hypothetical protein